MAAPGQRLDKWLWYTRLIKSRSLAARAVEEGKVRVNRVRVTKPSRLVHVEDVLTLVVHGRLRIFKVRGLGTRRGPAPEARALYDDMSPAPEPAARAPALAPGRREPGAGRPTKRDRRLIAAFTDDDT